MAELGAEVTVLRNDEVTSQTVADLAPDGVLVSPGPGHPRDAGNCVEIIRYCGDNGIPMFGVCLGHQALGEAFGATIDRAPELLHGVPASWSTRASGSSRASAILSWSALSLTRRRRHGTSR